MGLTRGGTLARSTLLNLLGLAWPALVGLFAVPRLVHGLGTERFGVLALMWVLVGSVGLLDLGLGRAVTRETSAALGAGRAGALPEMVWTSLLAALVWGTAAGAAAAALAGWLVRAVLEVPPSLQDEAARAFLVLSSCIPLVVTGAGLLGVLEAQQRFGAVNLIRALLTTVGLLAPLVVLRFTDRLDAVAAALVLGRAVSWLASLVVCLRSLPLLRTRVRLRPALLMPLLAAGGWMTVSSVLGPLLGHVNRLAIAARASLAQVTYYATPGEVLTRLWVVPGAVIATLFPAFAAAFEVQRGRATLLLDRGVRYVFLALFPVVVVIVAFAHGLLRAWLGPELALRCAPVVPWLAVAIFVNSLAHVPLVLLQAAGRPDLTAKVQLVQLPPYVAVAWWVAGRHGMVGVAVVYLVRNTLETAALIALAVARVPDGARLLPGMGLLLLGALAPLALVFGATSVPVVAALVAAVMAGFLPLAWCRILSHEERAFLRGAWRRLRVS